MNTYALGDAMSFVPRYPWNDDERDTKTFIQYCSSSSQEEYEYIPTFVIMKELYREQQEALYHVESDNTSIDDDWYCPYGYDYFGLGEEDDSRSSIDYTTDVEDESDDNSTTPKSEENTTEPSGDDGTASSPYVSNKFWYM